MPLPALEESRRLRYATAFGLYVMQGIPAGFALTAVANRLAASGVSPPTIGRFAALVGVPWTVQWLWGPLIDRFQRSRMGRRKPWVFFAQLLALAASLAVPLVHDPARQVGALTAVFVLHSVFASIQDASADAMAITVTRPEERARVNAYMRAGMLAGDAIGAAGLAAVMRRHGFVAAALTQSAVLLVLTVGTFVVRERRGDALVPWSRRPAPASADPPDASAVPLDTRAILATLRTGLLARDSVRMFGAVLAVYFAASVFIRAYSTHLVQQLRWDDTTLSVLTGTYGMAAAGLAIVGVGLLAGRIAQRPLLLGVVAAIGAFLVALGLLGPLWPHVPLARGALVAWYTCDPAFSVVAMPLLMGLCRPGVEGSQFTAYMALVNAADVAGNYVAGYALTVTTAPTIAVACGAVVLGAVEVLRRAPRAASAWGTSVPAAPLVGAEPAALAAAR